MVFSGNTFKLREPKANTLYHSSKSLFFEMTERDDHKDVIKCWICIGDYNEALFGREYRGIYNDPKGEKRADILCIMADEKGLRLKTYIYEVKHTISGVDRVERMLSQIAESVYQKDSMIMSNSVCREWPQEEHVGVITNRINEEQIRKRIARIQDGKSELEGLKGLINSIIYKKKRNEALAQEKLAIILSDFLERKFVHRGKVYDLEVLDLIPVNDHFECEVKFA